MSEMELVLTEKELTGIDDITWLLEGPSTEEN